RRARAERHPDQHGARIGGRRAGADPGAAAKEDSFGRPRRLRQRAGGAAGADRDGECRAVSSSRLGGGIEPHQNGPARGRQSRRLGGGQGAADAGRGNALAAAQTGVTAMSPRAAKIRRVVAIALALAVLTAGARAQAPLSDEAKAMTGGTWELSNAD